MCTQRHHDYLRQVCRPLRAGHRSRHLFLLEGSFYIFLWKVTVTKLYVCMHLLLCGQVRNSWGTSWGESGFIRLKYGANTCAITNDPTYVVVAKK